ncbi:strawberry notch C-terminal domain-containing protein [uncultured Sneathiella sp.]|jgi:hypothetical protein|uniref:strawberry notch C-terminal domain-containing protein n=1 Tax=uncultured Sneathiella sp. TaxID=879315 RepID=UPI0030EE21F7|tara:strand:+ start:85630 stop:103908 length:18279 start_codon:yes stop_codon:yes gene_type:complete
MATDVNNSREFLASPTAATSKDLAEFRRLETHLAARTRRVGKAVEDRFLNLQDLVGHNAIGLAPQWRKPDGQPVYSTGTVDEMSSGRYVTTPGQSLRAWRSGEFIDVAVFENGVPNGHATRIFEREWPASPVDQTALLSLLNPVMMQDALIDRSRLAINEITPGVDGLLRDWAIKLDLADPNILSTLAPRSLAAQDALRANDAYFSTGQPEWAMTSKHYLDKFVIVPLDGEAELELREIAGRNLAQAEHSDLKGEFTVFQDIDSPETLIAYRKRWFLDQKGPVPIAVRHNGMLHVFDGETHQLDAAAKKFGNIRAYSNACESSLLSGHREIIRTALEKKLPVPAEVLEEYPALRRMQSPNLAGDQRPVPEFGPEEDMITVSTHDDRDDIFANLLDEEREGMQDDFYLQQHFYDEAKRRAIQAYPDDYYRSDGDILEIAESAPYADRVVAETEAEFRSDKGLDGKAEITDDMAEELSDLITDALIEHCKDDATDDPDHDIWKWQDPSDSYTAFEDDDIMETVFELEYEHALKEVEEAVQHMSIITGQDDDEIVDYSILRNEDNDYHLYEDLNSNYQATHLGDFPTFDEATEAARQHARYGEIRRTWPVNEGRPNTKWLRSNSETKKIAIATGSGFDRWCKPAWLRGSFAIVAPFKGRPGFQAHHLPTGLPVGRVWGTDQEAKRFVDLLAPMRNWAELRSSEIDDVRDLVVSLEHQAGVEATETRQVIRTQNRNQRLSRAPAPSIGFGGPVAFSANMLDVTPPRFEIDRYSAFKPRDEDRNWFVARMRESAFETSIAEDFFDAHIETYQPGRETMRQWAAATHWQWHTMPEEEKSNLLDHMSDDEDIKAQLIFTDMADEFEAHINNLVDVELSHYANAVVLEDTTGQGYRVFFDPDSPSTMEVFAPGPISEGTFLGYARGEDALETISDAEEIAGQYAFRGLRAIDGGGLFKEMNPKGPEEWRSRVIILSENTPCVSRLAHGFAQKSFGIVRTDWHLGEKQPGAAVIHLASGTPIKPFFRRDKDAQAFADMIEMQADWHAIVSHEDFARESANLRSIARDTSAAIKEVSRAELKRSSRKPQGLDNAFAGAVAFKVMPAEKHEREIYKLIDDADPSRRISDKWEDFLTLASCAHRGAALPQDSDAWRENESRYLDVVDRYRRNKRLSDIRENFPNALGHLTAACRQYEDDTLGRLHMQIAPNSALGQEFTPYEMALLMTELTSSTLEAEKMQQLNSGKGFVEFSDPTSGSGVMAIAQAESLLRKHLDPTQHMRAYLTDIDHRACDMSYLNMALRDIPALVTHGNTLTQEIHSQSMTPAFVRARYEDIIKDRKAVNSRDIQESGLLDPKFSTGRDYRSLSESLVHLGAGPDLLDHTFVPSNDPAKGVPGEYARLQDVKELLWQANLVFDQAEKFGLSEPHPERSSMAPHKLYDSYHRELGARVGSFLENLDIAHPTTVRQAQPLLDEVAEHVKMFDAYVDAYGAPGTNYEALTTPRWKVADQMPVFGDLDELRVSEADIPDDDAIYSKLEELYPFYERQVKAEYLSRFGKDFIIDDVYIQNLAKDRKDDGIAKLIAKASPATEDAIEAASFGIVADEMRSKGLRTGDTDERELVRVHGDSIAATAEERAREVAFNELMQEAPVSIRDKDGIGYEIRNVPEDGAFVLNYHNTPIVSAHSFKEAQTLAIAHAQGADIDMLRNPDVALNPLGPADRFIRRDTVYHAGPVVTSDIHSVGRLVDPVVRGHFAVSRSLQSKPGWYITHLPSGFSCVALAQRFASEEAARNCVVELEKMGSWDITRRDVREWTNNPSNQDMRRACFELIESHIENSIDAAKQGRVENRLHDSKTTRGRISGPVAFKTEISSGLIPSDEQRLSDAIGTYLQNGHVFSSARALRTFCEDTLGFPIPQRHALRRAVEEVGERAMVRLAAGIYKSHTGSSGELIDKLAKLQDQLPNFSTRTSRSAELQAYSTPLPIAGLAARLLGAKPGEVTYDPTAGNGALLIGQDREDRKANELDNSRARGLDAKYVTTLDAAQGRPPGAHQHLIANPPFGALSEEQGKTLFLASEGVSAEKRTNPRAVATSRLHHAIVWNGLTGLPDDGRAVLILPSVRAHSDEAREQGYDQAGLRRFHWKLYDSFNVVDHITLSGDLYRQQGAGWPIDLIVIDGKGRSSMPLPTLSTPPVITSLEELKEICHVFDANRNQLAPRTSLSASAKLYASGKTAVRNDGISERDKVTDTANLSDRDPVQTGSDRESSTGGAGADYRLSASGSPESGSGGNDPQHRFSDLAAPTDLDTSRLPSDGNPGGTETAGSGRPDAGDRSMNESLVPYEPLSGAKPLETLMPANLVSSFDAAKARLVSAVGNVDNFVQEKLGYKTKEALYNALAGEQIDATAFAIHQHETGGSFINGHLMGIGKGRVASAMLVYAHLNGLTPIFITERPNLYPAIMRDLADIGYGHLRPLITNDGLTGAQALELPDGRVLSTPNKAKHDAELIRIRDQGHLGKDYDFVMTSWAQTQTVQGQETLRRMLLERLSKNALLVRDESHNAGGQDQLFSQPGPPNRAEFARELMWDAKGVYDSSATWAKAPHTMDLFGRTDLRYAVRDPKEIGSIIAQHGLPMQQMVASMLSESGQYMRLERSMEGIDYEFSVVNIDPKRFDKFAEILEAIAAFDDAKQGLLKGPLGKELKKSGEKAMSDGATGEVGINSIIFTSLLHNIAQQAELSLMADTVADKAIQSLENGQKPFITLANTMGAFMSEFVSANELQPGDAIDANFGDVLKRYLERSRDVTIGTPFSEKERIHLTDEQLGSRAKALFDRVEKLIEDADWSGMPVSPIDHVKGRLEQAGYKFGEFTGRSEGIDYSGDRPVYYRRTAAERSKAADVRTETAFNDGSIDVAVGNESVASGITLSANANFADQRPRLDITWQPHPDVTKHVQMKGRVNRTGQVHTPSYLHLMTDIPASRRNAARLERKLRSLNANTTANQKGLFQSGGIDMLNAIGDRAAATVMENNPAIHRRFGFPLKLASGARGLETDGAARKVTGRMIMLPVALQEKLYGEFETEFRAEQEKAERMGLIRDEARVHDLDARELSRAQLTKSVRAESPFGGPVHIKQMNVRNTEKPYPFARVLAEINKSLGLGDGTVLSDTQSNGREHAKALKERAKEQFERYRSASVERASSRNKQSVDTRLTGDFERFTKLVDNFPVGRSVLLKTPDGKDIYGVVAGLSKRGGSVNPVAPAAWTIKMFVADGAKEIELRLNELALPGEKPMSKDYTLIKADKAAIDVEGTLEVRPIAEAFDRPSKNDREERLVATGNILAAADQFRKANVMYFTTTQGTIEAGLLLPRDATLQEVLGRAEVILSKPEHVQKYLDAKGTAVTADNALSIVKRKDTIELRASRARSAGGKYWLDKDIRGLTGDFVSSGTSMVAEIKPAQLSSLLSLMEGKRMTLKASDILDDAREIVGAQVPEMVKRGPPKHSSAKPMDRFVMPWELRGEEAAPFAAGIQFSTGRPVALREEEAGALVPVNHQGAPGPQADGSRIHRVLDVPDYVSADQLLAKMHLDGEQGKYVHRFSNVFYSTGSNDTGLTVYNDDEVKDLPPHHDYETWQMRRGAAPNGWDTVDVPLLSPNGPVRYPGFVHPEAPGLAVVPFPRPGLRPGTYERDALRFVVLHKESGQALLPGNRFMYTANGAAKAALTMANAFDFKNLQAPDDMSRAERAHANKVVDDSYENARSTDRDAYIEFNLNQGVTAEFRESDLYWLVVDNAADPDIDLAAEMSQTSGCFYLYPDRDTAIDIGMEDAAPVRAKLRNIADLTQEPWSADVQEITRAFFDQHDDMLKMGLSTTYFERGSEFEEVERRVEAGEDEDAVLNEFVERRLSEFDYAAFEEAIRRQDYTSAGAYDGDLKDALMGWLSDKFDGVKLWEPFEYDQTELVIFNARDVELAWDQLATSIELARAQKAEQEARREEWQKQRSEDEVARLAQWRLDETESFDLAVLQERGFNVNDIHWLSVPNKEYPELDQAYAGANPVLFTRRTDAESLGRFDEAIPVYLRRGQGVDLTSDNASARAFIEQLSQIPGLDTAGLANLPGGDIGPLAQAATDLARAKGLDYIQFLDEGTKRSVLSDTSDISVAWDAIERKSIHRRSSDTMVGPALAAAKQAAALAAPRLLLTGPEGRADAEMAARSTSIFLQADEVRRLAGNDALLIFVENDTAQLFDRDAKRAHQMIDGLPLVEIGDIAEMELPARDANSVAEQLAPKHRVVIARLDENGQIVLENFVGNHVELETLTAEDADDPTIRAEREKKRARQRAGTWAEKPIADRYADVHLAARNREVPALVDGDRYVIAGLLARQLSDEVPLLKENLQSDGELTWFSQKDLATVTSSLAALDKRLMLAEGLSRATWRQSRVGAAQESQTREEVTAQSAIEQHAELANRHPDRVVFVEDGEGFRTFSDNVQTIAKIDPHLTSKFEKVHDTPSIALTRDEMDYQAKQMSQRGLHVTIAERAQDGSVSLRNFDPMTEVVNESDVTSAISGQNKEAVTSERKHTLTEQDREAASSTATANALHDVVRSFDEQKSINREAVHLIEHGDGYVLFDGDARLVARHFEPVRNRLEYFTDSMERTRIVGHLSANVLERAIEQLRNRSVDLVVMKRGGDGFLAEAHGATRHQPEYPAVQKDAAARRGFDLSKKSYAPVSGSGAFMGKPLVDGVAFYSDPIAAGSNQIEVHTRVKNPARLNSTDLNSFGWRAPLQKMVDNLKQAYGIESAEQLKQILSDGRMVSWWTDRLSEMAIGGDPMDLQRSVFNELRKLGHDGAIMIDPDGYEVNYAFDPEAILPAQTVQAVSVTQQQTANIPRSAQSAGMPNTIGQSAAPFTPNRFGLEGLQVSVQAAPQSREELKSALDEITRAFDTDGGTADKRAAYLREAGLLNVSLAGRISRYTEDIYPILPGYVIYPGDNGKWVYASVRDFVSATGPTGNLYGRWAPEMSDQISDYAAFYLNQLDAAFEPQLARVKEELTDMVSEINPDVDLRFVERLFADGTVEGSPDRRPVLGLYFRHTDAMPISTDISKGDPRVTGLHELYHSLSPLLNPEEHRVVSAGFGGEEKAAEAFAHWAMGTAEGRRLGPIQNLYQRMNNILHGNGFRSWQDVFQAARVGEVAGRAKVLEMSSDIEIATAQKLANAANLPALGEAVSRYGARLEGKTIPMETLYQLLAGHLDDLEITQAVRKAGFHRINDDQSISTIPATRHATIEMDLARHRKLTPIDIGSNDPHIARRISQTTQAQARRVNASVHPSPSIQRRADRPHVIRYKAVDGEILQNNIPARTSSNAPVRSMIKDIVLQERYGLPTLKSSEYLQRNPFIARYGDTGMSEQVAGQEIQIPMATRGSADIIDETARPVYILPDDMDRLVDAGIVGEGDKGLLFDATSGAYYVALSHPSIDHLLENFGTVQAQQLWSRHKQDQAEVFSQVAKEFSTIAYPVPETERVYVFPIGPSEVQMARSKGAQFDDRPDFRIYYIDRNSENAQNLIDRFGPTGERIDRYKDWRKEQFGENIQRRSVAISDSAAMDGELGHEAVKQIGRSAVFSAGLGGAIAASTQVAASTPTPSASVLSATAPEEGSIEMMFERLGTAEWREIIDKSSLANSAAEVWSSLSSTTQEALSRAGIAGERASHQFAEAFADIGNSLAQYSTLTERVTSSGSLDEARAHIVSFFANGQQNIDAGNFFEALIQSEEPIERLETLKAVAYNTGNSIKDWASDSLGSITSGDFPDVQEFAPGLSELRTSTVESALPHMKAQIASTFDGWVQTAKEVSKPAVDVMREAIGPKVTAAVSAIGGTAGLTAIAGAAASAGAVGAGVAASVYMARRNERRKIWAEDSRDMPWKLTSKQFGQVAKKHYSIARSETDGIDRISITRKSDGQKVYEAAAPIGGKLSAREAVAAAHASLVDKAISSNLPVPDAVKISVLESAKRDAGQGFGKAQPTTVNDHIGQEMLSQYVSKVPAVMSGTNDRQTAEQLAKLPISVLASAALKTQQSEELAADPERKKAFKAGTALISSELNRRNLQAAGQFLSQSAEQQQVSTQQRTKSSRRKGPSR